MNTGKKCSEMDLWDLANGIRLNHPIEEIASFMCRSRRELRDKIAELRRSGELRLLLCPKSMDEAGTIGGPLTEGGQFVVFDCSCAAQGRRWSAETTVDQALIRGFRLPCLRLGAGPCLNGGRRAAARPRSKG